MPDSTNASSNPGPVDRSTTNSSVQRPKVGLAWQGDRSLTIGGIAVLMLFAIGWTWSIAHAAAATGRDAAPPTATRTVAAALTLASAPTVAYVTDAALEALAKRARGTSGKLRAEIGLPGALDAALKQLTNFDLIELLPFSAKRNGRVGLYYIGNWPGEQGARGLGNPPGDRYAIPQGFIEVTPENQDTRVSEHFRLKDFLTHDQPNVWPKYIVLQMRNVDKLELVLEDLARRGVDPSGVVVMSGFRTPRYNASGGNTAGRAGLSRHMYGDAADIYIDNGRHGVIDDLNHDGRVDIDDARFILESVDRVEREHPELIGGAGVYVACCGHGPFIHIDSRGYRARWTGSVGG